ncbi:MAG TPA: hypothetical protein VF533_11300 [Solirubrobacteraceae bacterium]|jgi:hypothetical protein
MHGRRLAPAVAALLLLVASAPGPAGAAPRRRCIVPSGADVLARGEGTVVWRLRGTRDAPADFLPVYGCRRGQRRFLIQRLEANEGFVDEVVRARATRRFGAIVVRQIDHYGCASTTATSADLRRRRTVTRVFLGSTFCSEPFDAIRVPDLVVSRSGALGATLDTRGHREILTARGRHAAPVMVAGGPALDLRSLTLTGAEMAWREDGERRSTSLP